MQFKKLTFFVFFTILLFTGCEDKDTKSITDDMKNIISKENKSTTIKLQTIDKKIVKTELSKNKIIFEGAKNKIVLLNFFATWCSPCIAEIPHLNALIRKYPNDFEVIAVLLEDNKLNQEIVDFVNDHEIIYPITYSQENYHLEQAVGGVKFIPTMYLLDRDGTILQKYVGVVLEEMLDIDIKQAIERK